MNLKSERGGWITLQSFNNEIKFENVSFSYNKSDLILNNINFTVHRGEKVGICGGSGEGKTTLFKLLSGFYDPTEGRISIDGVGLENLERYSVRKKVGVVSQDVHIFNTSIRENIKYGSELATDYEIIEASKKAGLYDFIQSLPDKFETLVGPKGLKLSGGQKQRISLARVFLKNPEIILLDEATSALDNRSESIVQESLDKLGDKTIITIAHRLSTIQNYDKIIVLENHTVAGEGTHKQLMDSCKAYINLYIKS